MRNHYPEFEKVLAKTGIETVHSAGVDAAELACRAARELLDQTEIDQQTVGAVLVVSQSPRYFLPGISSLVHAELGLSSNCITFDLNQGCSGFVQGLIVANGFVEQGRYVLLICTDMDLGRRVLLSGPTSRVEKRLSAIDQLIASHNHAGFIVGLKPRI